MHEKVECVSVNGWGVCQNTLYLWDDHIMVLFLFDFYALYYSKLKSMLCFMIFYYVTKTR